MLVGGLESLEGGYSHHAPSRAPWEGKYWRCLKASQWGPAHVDPGEALAPPLPGSAVPP